MKMKIGEIGFEKKDRKKSMIKILYMSEDGTEEDTKETEAAEKKWKERGKLHEGDRGKWSFKDRVRIKREEE